MKYLYASYKSAFCQALRTALMIAFVLFIGRVSYSQCSPGTFLTDANIGGNLEVDGSGCVEGTFTDRTISGNIEVKSSGDGLNITISGTLTVTGDIKICDGCTLYITGGAINMNGSVENNGSFELVNSGIQADGSIVVKGSGTTDLSGSSIETTGGDFSIESGGTINLTNGSSLEASGSGKITNEGDITSDGTGNSITASSVEGTGTEASGLDCGTPGAGCTDASALPVELLYFSSDSSNPIRLIWATASELNNDYFAIERSEDGINFYEIGRVSGNGTTNQVMKYAFEDRSPLGPVAYYRLRQVDYDGAFETFSVLAVETEIKNETMKMTVYPSIVSGEDVYIKSNSPFQIYSVKIYNLSGGMVLDFTHNLLQENPLTYTLKTNELKTGIHLLKVMSSVGIVHNSRIVVR